jgi:hypothetical protein
MSILRHQQIRTGVAQVHCKEGSARNPIAAIIRHTGSMPELSERRKALRFSALRLLSRMLDETAFLSDFGVRSMSKFYGEHPYVFERAGHRFTISYVPGDSAAEVFGGTMLRLGEVAAELSRRLCRIFLRGPDGKRPVFGDSPIEQKDPHFRDKVLFYEFFHGDTGRGLGASHQTGWTALVALLLRSYSKAAADRKAVPAAVAEAALADN